MKTTIDIPDSFYAQAKKKAKSKGLTFRDLVLLALRTVMTETKDTTKPFKLRDASFKGDGLQDGVDESSWEIIRYETYKGRGE